LYITPVRGQIKPVEFLGSSLDDLRAFPQGARREAGFQIDRVQHGEEPFDWKPISSVGHGVHEIRLRDATGAYRILYVAKIEDAIYILHCFKKKTQKTSSGDIGLGRERLRELMSRVQGNRK
jgi:phage-related protein